MPKPRKYKDLYGARKAYRQTEKGKEAVRRYNASEAAKASKRKWKRKHDRTILDKRQWFIEQYGDIQIALNLLDEREREVITLVYGLDGNEPVKQKEIATRWGKSPQWISLIKKDAEEKLLPIKLKLESSD